MNEMNKIRDAATREALLHLDAAEKEIRQASKIADALTSGSLPHYRDYYDVAEAIDKLSRMIKKYREERGLFGSSL